MKKEEAIDIMINGNEDRMRSLVCGDCNEPYSYVYFGAESLMHVRCGCQKVGIEHISDIPNCVMLFGNSHTFA